MFYQTSGGGAAGHETSPYTGPFTSVRRLLPAFSAPSGLCCRSFPCLTERWTELESENEPPRKRKRLSLRRKDITGDGLVGAQAARFLSVVVETLSLERGSLRSPYLS